MHSITRANPYLGEIIEILDIHRSKYRAGDIGDDEARASLTTADNEWIDGECYHCLTDARYFLSNYYAIRTEDKGFQGLYPFFDSQEILYEELRKIEKERGRVRAMIAKARRMGYTTYMIGEFLHKTVIRYKHTDAIIVSQDEKGTKYNMGMYESAFDFLPWWIKPRVNLHQTGALYNFDEPDENLRSSRPGLKNWVYADNANRPSGVGRGQGFRCGMLDELAFWNNASQLSKSLLRAMIARDGFYVMGSTGNGRNNAWHNLWRSAEAGSIDWQPIFIPFYRRPTTYSLPLSPGEVFKLTPDDTEMVDAIKEKEGVIISKETIKWMRKTKEEFIATDGDDMLFSQEYPLLAEDSFQNAIISAIPRGILNRYSKRTRPPIKIGEIGYDWNAGKPTLKMRNVEDGDDVLSPETEDRFHIWELPIRGENYAMGIDVALGNVGGDYSCVQVVRLATGKELDRQVACWRGWIDPEALAEVTFAIGWLYNEAMAAVEVNSFGMVTNNELVRNMEYENIYRFKRLDRLKHFTTDIVGWWTDYKSKRALWAKMSKMMQDDMIVIPDRYTLDELRDCTEDGAEGEGAHDDRVMAILIAVYCGHEGEENLRQKERASVVQPGTNKFKILDRFGTIIATTTSQNEAQRVSKKHMGSSIIRESGATASVMLGGRKRQIPADLQNTDFSPVFDGNGTARKLYEEEDVAPEDITPEMMQEYEAEQEQLENDPESWKYV